MENKNDIIMAVRNEGPTNEEMGKSTLPISLSIFQLTLDYADGDSDDELRVEYYTAQSLGIVSGVITTPNQSRDLFCCGGILPDVVRNDQEILVITHMSAELPTYVLHQLASMCANIYGPRPAYVIDVSRVLDVEDEAVMAQE